MMSRRSLSVCALVLLVAIVLIYAIINSVPFSDIIGAADIHWGVPLSWNNLLILILGVLPNAGAVFVEIIPYFAGGVLLGGFLLEFISKPALEKYMGKGGIGSIFVATGAGCVIPICSCGIVPVLAGLVEAGLPLPPIIAFLVSAPMLNPATLTMTIGILGIKIAIFRVIAVFGISIGMGLIVKKLLEIRWLKNPVKLYIPPKLSPQLQQVAFQMGIHLVNNPEGLTTEEISQKLGRNVEQELQELEGVGLLSRNSPKWRLVTGDLKSPQNACFVMGEEGQKVGSFGKRIIKALSYSWGSFLGLSYYVLLGVLIAGGIKVFLPLSLVTAYLGGVTINSVLLAAVIAILIYVCTCSDVPMVDALITKGMGGGAALAFLLGGPGLSLPSLAMLSGVFKRKLLLVYATVSFIGSVIAGYLFNMFFSGGGTWR